MSRRRIIFLALTAIIAISSLGAAAYVFFLGTSEELGATQPDVELLELGEGPAALRLTIFETGVASITASQIRQTSLPVETISSETVRLTRDGQIVPFHVEGSGSGATLYFYAEAISDTLEAPAVYWLSPGLGQNMIHVNAQKSGAVETVGLRSKVWEDNTTFLAQSEGDDAWLGKPLYAPNSLDVALDSIQPADGSGTLTIRIWSNNQAQPDPDHHIQILLNGQKLDDHFWDGIRQETLSVKLPPGTLLPTGNILTLNVPGDTGAAGEALYIDWIQLDYEGLLEAQDGGLSFYSDADNFMVGGADQESLVLEISEAEEPVILTSSRDDEGILSFGGRRTGSTYHVFSPASAIHPLVSAVPHRNILTASDTGADYIAIVADTTGFAEALQPLLDYRTAQGHKVLGVAASQIYDEFGFGRQTPTAIRDFLAFAVAEWEPAPRFVLLVGDASYDIYNFSEGRNRNLLPTHLVFSEFAGYVASDTWFTIFDEQSLSPELAIGRFPAQTVGQVERMVNKTLEYEQSKDTDWYRRALLVADDEPTFDNVSNDLAVNLDAIGYRTQKLYMSENEDIHDAIVSALNQGVGVINYVGHGAIEVWGDEKVFETRDANILTNGQRLPIFTTFTCLNGYFNHPDVDALAETLLWAEDGGVVAAIAPSGRSLTSQQLPLADVFYQRLLSGEASTLGEALQMAKIAGADDENLRDVIHTFNLLGDPALKFQLPLDTG